jgi:hypothetical protein
MLSVPQPRYIQLIQIKISGRIRPTSGSGAKPRAFGPLMVLHVAAGSSFSPVATIFSDPSGNGR